MSTNIYEARIATLERRVEELERQQTEVRLFERSLLKRDFLLTTVQIIAMVLAIFGAGGYLSYQNSLLVQQLDRRFEQMEKRFEDMKQRFDDMKQVVLLERQQQPEGSSTNNRGVVFF